MSKLLVPFLILLIALLSYPLLGKFKTKDLAINGPTPTSVLPTKVVNQTPQVDRLLTDFAAHSWKSVLPNLQEPENEILKKAITKDASLKILDIDYHKNRLKTLQVADAPEMRAGLDAWTKICLAETIFKKEPTKVLENCGLTSSYPKDIDWNAPKRSLFIDNGIDDIDAAAQILPFFYLGSYYQSIGDTDKAGYYYRQIDNHRDLGVKKYGDNFIESAGSVYKEISATVK